MKSKKVCDLYKTGQEVGGVVIVGVVAVYGKENTIYEVINTCCGMHTEIQGKTILARSRRGTKLCKSCGAKLASEANRIHRQAPVEGRLTSFATGPLWEPPKSAIGNGWGFMDNGVFER